jgi:hypothetical protein
MGVLAFTSFAMIWLPLAWSESPFAESIQLIRGVVPPESVSAVVLSLSRFGTRNVK